MSYQGNLGIRVWRGYRHASLDRPGFQKQLSQTFIPVTVQWLEPMGLCGYFPALLPELSGLPDELALVIYPSIGAYEEVSHTCPTGRAYGQLHGTLFAFGEGSSHSDFPTVWQDELSPGQSYSLNVSACSWRGQNVSLWVAQYDELDASHLKAWLSQQTRPMIVALEPGYFFCWYVGEVMVPDIKGLRSCFHASAQRVNAFPQGTLSDPGVPIAVGECLDVRLSGVGI